MLISSRRFVNDVGPLQRKILVWAGLNSMAVSSAMLNHVDLWKRLRNSDLIKYGPTEGYGIKREALDAWGRELVRLKQLFDKGLTPFADHRLHYSGRPWITWRPAAVSNDLNAPASASAYSHALRKLAEKSLLDLRDAADGRGLKRRTDAIRLTKSGVVLAIALMVAIADGNETTSHIAALTKRIDEAPLEPGFGIRDEDED